MRFLITVSLALLIALTACGLPKVGLSIADKCDQTPGKVWAYSHTKRWVQMVPVYDSKGNLSHFNQVWHSEEVWECEDRQ